MYGRIIAAGGGTVINLHSLEQLADDLNSFAKGTVTHVFLDPWDVATDMFTRVERNADYRGHSIYFLHYHFIFIKLQQILDTVEEDFNILNPEVLEMVDRTRTRILEEKRRKRRTSPSRRTSQA